MNFKRKFKYFTSKAEGQNVEPPVINKVQEKSANYKKSLKMLLADDANNSDLFTLKSLPITPKRDQSPFSDPITVEIEKDASVLEEDDDSLTSASNEQKPFGYLDIAPQNEIMMRTEAEDLVYESDEDDPVAFDICSCISFLAYQMSLLPKQSSSIPVVNEKSQRKLKYS